MKFKKILIFIIVYLTFTLCHGQVNPLDSCGIDSRTELNRYEIIVLDSLYLTPIRTKKTIIDPKNGFDFKDKKVAFFSCTKNSNSNGNGLLTKKEFFNLFKPKFFGHAGRGIIVFNDQERKQSNGFDAVVIIDCPYDIIKNEEIIQQLLIEYP